MKVMIVVTHLLGSGHLSRALVLARAFEAEGHAVVLASGGLPAPQLDTAGLHIVQLTPVRSDGVNFTNLLDQSGAPAREALFDDRKRQLVACYREMTPDVLITELFPFGRRVLAPEFKALLKAAKTPDRPPLILASVRDILAPPSKPAKAAATEALISQFYDGVLVHADPDLTPLDLSWPVSPALTPALHYTGYVAPPVAVPDPQAPGQGEVIVSAGGGDVGLPLFHAALAAAASDGARHWRLLVGGSSAAQTVADLRARAAVNATIEPARRDFRQMLHHAAASVSFCGYNTALDVLQAGTPAVFVPFDDGGELEQRTRASALSRLDGIAVLAATEVTAARVLTAVEHVCRSPRRAVARHGFDGAAQTVRIVSSLLAVRA